MPTVPVKMRVEHSHPVSGVSNEGPYRVAPGEFSGAGSWRVQSRAYDDTPLPIRYFGVDPVDANSKLSAAGVPGFVWPPEQDEELVSVDIPVSEVVISDGMVPGEEGFVYVSGQLIEGTITYPDTWREAVIWLDYIFSDVASFLQIRILGFVYAPLIKPLAIDTVLNSGFPYNYYATRVRETGAHDFRFHVQHTIWGNYEPNIFNLDQAGQADSGRQIIFDWGSSIETMDAPPLSPGFDPHDGYAEFNKSHTFPGPGEEVSVYVVDGDGQKSRTLTLLLPPIAKAHLVSGDGQIFYFDFSDSYDPDSNVATPFGVFGPNDEGLYWIDRTAQAETLIDDLVVQVPLIIFDNQTPNPGSDAVYTNVTVEPLGFFGTLIDHTRTLYTAVDGVTIYRFPKGFSSRETVGTIAGYKFPSLWCDATGAFYCSAKSASSGEYHVFLSYNRGKDWTQLTTETMWGTNYKKSIDCGVPVGGGAASVALLTVDSNTQKLLFKYAPDGKTWPPDNEAVEIATLTGADRIKSAQVRQVHGSIELRVTDGALKVWSSIKLGAAGSWALIP